MNIIGKLTYCKYYILFIFIEIKQFSLTSFSLLDNLLLN